MGKLPQLLCLLALAVLGFGTLLLPNNPIFWLASAGIEYQAIRVLLVSLVVVQLLTQPPRSIRVRMLSGVVAAFLSIWTIQQIYTFHMQLLDMVFVGASLLLTAVALEQNIVEVVKPKPFRVRVHRVSAYRTQHV